MDTLVVLVASSIISAIVYRIINKSDTFYQWALPVAIGVFFLILYYANNGS